VWCVVCGVWCVVCGVWCVVCGVWCVVCGVWCVSMCASFGSCTVRIRVTLPPVSESVEVVHAHVCFLCVHITALLCVRAVCVCHRRHHHRRRMLPVQGDVESLASRRSEDLVKYFEAVSRSEKFKGEYDRLEAEKKEAEEAFILVSNAKKTLQAECKEVRRVPWSALWMDGLLPRRRTPPPPRRNAPLPPPAPAGVRPTHTCACTARVRGWLVGAARPFAAPSPVRCVSCNARRTRPRRISAISKSWCVAARGVASCPFRTSFPVRFRLSRLWRCAGRPPPRPPASCTLLAVSSSPQATLRTKLALLRLHYVGLLIADATRAVEHETRAHAAADASVKASVVLAGGMVCVWVCGRAGRAV
jgi:hypothetical protein